MHDVGSFFCAKKRSGIFSSKYYYPEDINWCLFAEPNNDELPQKHVRVALFVQKVVAVVLAAASTNMVLAGDMAHRRTNLLYT